MVQAHLDLAREMVAAGLDWHRDDRVSHDEGYSTHLIAREAARLVTDHDPARPLFLYVPFNAVHGPHQVPQKSSRTSLPDGTRSRARTSRSSGFCTNSAPEHADAARSRAYTSALLDAGSSGLA